MSTLHYVGIDTSNYRTSAAWYEPAHHRWRNEGSLLPVPEGALGLRQSEALFRHTVVLHEKLRALGDDAVHPAAIGVSTRPRAVQGSYMPCFLAGESVARSAAALLGVPVYAVSHQQGHLAAAACSVKRFDLLDNPFLAWHLSGGTTELLLVRPGDDGLPACTVIGGTTDLAAGQLIDRAGVLLGLSFPAGAALDRLATEAAPCTGFAPRVKDCFFSLSGVQNQVEKQHITLPPADLARFTLQTVANAVYTATKQALALHPLPVLCAGGVMASDIVRERLRPLSGHLLFADPVLSGDNAVGVAVLAARLHARHSTR